MPDQVLESAETSSSGEHEWLGQILGLAPGFAALLEGEDHHIVMANPAFCDLVGKRELIGKTLAQAVPELARQEFAALLDAAAISGQALVENRMSMRVDRSGDGRKKCSSHRLPAPGQWRRQAGGCVRQGHEVTGDQRNETIRAAHNKVLELAMATARWNRRWASSSGSSNHLPDRSARVDPPARPDGKHLRHGAAPSLPPPYTAAIDGAEIGPCAGSCGTAAYLGEPVSSATSRPIRLG